MNREQKMTSDVVDQVATYATSPINIPVAGMIIFGLPLEDWVVIGTAILVFLNLSTRLWKTYSNVRIWWKNRKISK